MPKRNKPRSALALKRYLRKRYQAFMSGKPPPDAVSNWDWWDGATEQIERTYQYMFGENILDWYAEWHARTVDHQKEAK